MESTGVKVVFFFLVPSLPAIVERNIIDILCQATHISEPAHHELWASQIAAFGIANQKKFSGELVEWVITWENVNKNGSNFICKIQWNHIFLKPHFGLI